MSFLLSLFTGSPDQTEEEYAQSLIGRLEAGEDISLQILNLKDISFQNANIIGESGIPALIKAISDNSSDNELVLNAYIILNDLLREECSNAKNHALTMLKQEETLSVLIKGLDSTNPNRRQSSMHLLMRLVDRQPDLFQEELIKLKPQMIRLFASVQDSNEQIASLFVQNIPALINGNQDFQQIVGYHTLEGLVNRININKPEYIIAISSILNGCPQNQALFANSGYFEKLAVVLQQGDEVVLSLLAQIFSNPRAEEYKEALSQTNLIPVMIDNIIKGKNGKLNSQMILLITKDHITASQQVYSKLPILLNLFLDTGNTEILDFLQRFILLSNANVIELVKAISTVHDISPPLIDVATSCLLAYSDSRNHFQEFFVIVIKNFSNPLLSLSAMKFIICFCWEFEESCNSIVNHTMFTSLLQLHLFPSGNPKVKALIPFLLAELVLFLPNLNQKLGLLNASINIGSVKEALNQSDVDRSNKWGQFQLKVIDSLNDKAKEEEIVKSVENCGGDNQLMAKQLADSLTKINSYEKMIKEMKTQMSQSEKEYQENQKEYEVKIQQLISKKETEHEFFMNVRKVNKNLQQKCDELTNRVQEMENQKQNEGGQNDYVEELKEKIKNLQAKESEHEQKKMENEQLRKQIENLKQDNINQSKIMPKAQTSENNEGFQQILNENKKIQIENDDLKSKVMQMSQEIRNMANIQDTTDELKDENERLSKKIEKMQQQNEKLLEQLESRNLEQVHDESNIQEQSINYNDIIDQLKEQNKELSQENSDYLDTITELQKQLTKLQHDNKVNFDNDLIEQIEQLKEDNKLLNSGNKSLLQENNALNNQVKNLSTQNETLENKLVDSVKIDNLELQMQKVTEEKNSLFYQVQQLQQDNSELKDLIANYKNQNEIYQQNTIDQHSEDISTLIKENNELTQKINEMKQESVSKIQYEDALASNQDLKDQIKFLSETMNTGDQYEQKYQIMKKENKSLREQIKSNELLISNLMQKPIDDTSNQLHMQLSEYESMIDKLRDENSEYLKLINENKKSIKSLNSQLIKMKEENQKLISEKNKRTNTVKNTDTAKIQDLNEMIKRQKVEATNLKTKLSFSVEEEERLRKENNKLKEQIYKLSKNPTKNVQNEKLIQDLRQQNTLLALEVKQLRSDNQNQASAISDLQEMLQESKKPMQIKEVEDQYYKLALEHETITQQYTDMQMQLQPLINENQKLKAQLKRMNENSAHLSISKAEVERQRETSKNLQIQIEQQKSVLSSLEQSIVSLNQSSYLFGNSSNSSDENQHKKALRMIGKLWLDHHSQY